MTYPHNRLTILKGDKFNYLTILEEVENYTIQSGIPKRAFKCECVCGKELVVVLEVLRAGQKSCGCRNVERPENWDLIQEIKIRYEGVKARCNNINHKEYKNYGGRGIIVEESFNSFEKFYNWAINNGYDKNLDLDRINNNGNYSTNNCRFISRKINSRNKRNSIQIPTIYEIFEGKYKDISSCKIAKETGYNKSTICRVRKRDYSEQLEEYKQNKLKELLYGTK